jgi:hypothetical protein
MKKFFNVIASSLILVAGAAAAIPAHATNLSTLYTNAELSGLNYQPLHDALNAYAWAKSHGEVHNNNVLTVIDYTLPSTEKRLWVLDLKSDKVLSHALVAHGHNSGYIYADHFSNAANSHETSLGVYTTGQNYYYGKHGRSLKVHGLEKGVNSNAYARAIEIHPAAYVSQSDIQKYGRIGRTYGCFGLNPKVAERIVSETVGGSVVFAYAHAENNDPVVEEG